MTFPKLSFRTLRVGTAALALTLGAAACGDDDGGPEEPEPQVQTMRLTVGGTAYDFTTSSTPTIPLRANTATTVTAQFLLANGQPEPLVTAEVFELRIAPTAASDLTFTRTGAFAGTLTTGRAAGQSFSASAALYHRGDDHNDFGPRTFSVNVTP